MVKNVRYRIVLATVVGFVVILNLSSGVSLYVRHVSRSSYYRNAQEVMGKVRQFMDENTSPATPVATPDSGVIPFTLGRTCYKTLYDESHLLSLERMSKYQTGYLVIGDQVGRASPYARKMVEDIPQLFSPMLEVQPEEGEGPAVAVYSVDIEGVQKFLNSVSKHEKAKENEY
jgi:hypothetical protein